MPLLQVEAAKLSNNDLEAGVIEEIIDRDGLFSLLPFKETKGKAYVYNREKTLSEAQFLDPNEAVPEGGADYDEVVTKLRILAGDVDVDKFLDTTMDDTNDQTSEQISAKAKGLRRAFQRNLIIGNSGTNAKQFDGVDALCTSEGIETVIDANGAALTLSALDQLVDEVKNGVSVLMMRAGTLRAIRALWRAAGGNTGGDFQIGNFGLTLPGHNGIPIIVNDFIPGNVAQGTSPNTCSIYAIKLDENEGLHGLWGGRNAGIVVEDIGTVQNKDANRFRLKWYCGLALKSTQSMHALRGVTNV